jgi:calcineurin-like phosphoesterase
MQREYKNVIFTNHALERLELRRMTQEMVFTTIIRPDHYREEDDGDSEFIKVVNGRRVHVISVYLSNEQKWLVKSAWVRGEGDPNALWQWLLRGLRRLVRGH